MGRAVLGVDGKAVGARFVDTALPVQLGERALEVGRKPELGHIRQHPLFIIAPQPVPFWRNGANLDISRVANGRQLQREADLRRTLALAVRREHTSRIEYVKSFSECDG